MRQPAIVGNGSARAQGGRSQQPRIPATPSERGLTGQRSFHRCLGLANGRANGRCAKRANLESSDANQVTLAQVEDLARECITLIIRRSWVRSPAAPLFGFVLVSCVFSHRPAGRAVTCVAAVPSGVPMSVQAVCYTFGGLTCLA